MPRIIEQSVTLPASAERLFEMYLDPKAHGAIIGGPVSISAKEGSRFRAFNGMITGKTLMVLPKYMIVQSWRGSHWQMEDIDSILILTFRNVGEKARIDMIHANVADSDYEGVRTGWDKFYWKPWKAYLDHERHELKKMRSRAA
jgi:activator of HSP90 ATPase